MAYALKSREALGRIEAQMRGITARCEKQNRGLNSDERETWNRLVSEHETVQGQIRIQEVSGRPRGGPSLSEFGDLEEIQDSYRLAPRQQRERHVTEHDRAFSNFIRNGMERIDEEDRALVSRGANVSAIQNFALQNGRPGAFRNAQATSPGSAGGYIVPQGFSNLLEEAMKWFGGIDGVVDTFRTDTGNPFPWPTVNDTVNIGRIIGQNVQVVETDLAFGQVVFNAYIGSSDLVLIPLSLLQDSYFDLDRLLASMLGTRLGRLLNRKGTIGTGSGEPTGIVPAAAAAGNIVVFGAPTVISYTNLVDVEGAVDPAYRENPTSRWMFSDAVLKNIKKLVDGNNRPLWQPGLTASFGDGAPVTMGAPRPTILNHQYAINADMPAPVANANSILFGDMRCFKHRKVGELQLMRLVERYADYLQVGFISWMRFDTNLVNAGTNPIALGQQSAS